MRLFLYGFYENTLAKLKNSLRKCTMHLQNAEKCKKNAWFDSQNLQMKFLTCKKCKSCCKNELKNLHFDRCFCRLNA